jgi:hypothetical protein
MSIVDMAIRDISRHHDQRLRRVLKKEIDSAAKDYADDIEKSVHWEKQSEKVRAQRRAAEMTAEQKHAKKKQIAKRQKNGWLDLF